MKYRIVTIGLIMFFICGCQASYTLNFDENFEITENFEVLKSTDDIGAVNKTSYVNEIIESQQGITYPIDGVKFYSDNENTGIKYSKKYEGTNDYLNSSFCKNVKCKIEIGKSTFDGTKEYDYFQLFFVFDGYPYYSAEKNSDYYVEQMSITINFPYTIIETNADSNTSKSGVWNLESSIINRVLFIKYDSKEELTSNPIDNDPKTDLPESNDNVIKEDDERPINDGTTVIDIEQQAKYDLIYYILIIIAVLVFIYIVMSFDKKKRK